jgi:hypothetical protein
MPLGSLGWRDWMLEEEEEEEESGTQGRRCRKAEAYPDDQRGRWPPNRTIVI